MKIFCWVSRYFLSLVSVKIDELSVKIKFKIVALCRNRHCAQIPRQIIKGSQVQVDLELLPATECRST